MVASAANGFQNTNHLTCAGTPYNFHPEYGTAAVNNIVPWAALMLGPSLDVEIGHYEHCDSDSDDACFNVGGQVFSPGEDFDFDGTPYHPHGWSATLAPTAHHAGAVNLQSIMPGSIGPVSYSGGVASAYPIFELETDIGLTLFQTTSPSACNLLVPNSCSVDNLNLVPTFSGFYPYFSTKGCTAAFGNVHGTGWNTYGGVLGYGGTQPSFQGTIALWITNGAYYTNSC
jgi:hypothetical protein